MRYVISGDLITVELPPDEDSGETGWVKGTRLSAGDYAAADRHCRRLGFDVRSLDGVIFLLSRCVKEWSLPLPADGGKLMGSLQRLSIELLTFLGQQFSADQQMTEEARQDLPDEPSDISAETETAA